MKKQYINPTIKVHVLAAPKVICTSQLGFGGTETDGIAGVKNSYNSFDDDDEDEEY